jgi:putative tricarboxylic transport membrane protein
MKAPVIATIAAVAASVMLTAPASAQNKVSFKGQTIRMVVPTTAGGSTDISARLIARYLSKYLPGNPAIIVANMPGGHGVPALNFLVQQTKRDGLSLSLTSNSQVDPLTWRTPQSHYDPTKFNIIGGIGIGDNIMIIRKDALPRLYDKSKKPVAMGSVAGAPRSGMRMTIFGIKFLGWNAKWVTGYPGSPSLVLALENGELDMTSFPRFYVVNKLTDTNKFKIIYLDGLRPETPPSGRADADNAPLFTKAMEGKIKDPKYQAAYNYWHASKIFKWLSLAPDTPAPIVAAYDDAFQKMTKDPEFKATAEKSIEGYSALSKKETTQLIDDLANTPDEAIQTLDAMMREQGIDLAKTKKKKKK